MFVVSKKRSSATVIIGLVTGGDVILRVNEGLVERGEIVFVMLWRGIRVCRLIDWSR